MHAQQQWHILIQGHVQGVGYRYALRQKAFELQLIGWCHNTPSGHVEAQVLGSRETLDTLLTWCHQGPPQAKVSNIQTQVMPTLETAFKGFEIR